MEPAPVDPLDPHAVAEAHLVHIHATAIAHEVIGGFAPDVISGAPSNLPELVTWSVRTAAAAVLLEDATIVTDHVSWLRELLDAGRGMGWAARPTMRTLIEAMAPWAPSLPPLVGGLLD
jgi:hypothetical protein